MPRQRRIRKNGKTIAVTEVPVPVRLPVKAPIPVKPFVVAPGYRQIFREDGTVLTVESKCANTPYDEMCRGQSFGIDHRGKFLMNRTVTHVDCIVLNWLKSNQDKSYHFSNAMRNIVDHYYDSCIHFEWIDQLARRAMTMSEDKARYYHLFVTDDDMARFVQMAEDRFKKENAASYISIPKSFLFFKELIGLNDVETFILYMSFVYLQCGGGSDFHNLNSLLYKGDEDSNRAALFGIDQKEYELALKGFLFQSGILVKSNATIGFGINSIFAALFSIPNPTEENVAELLFPQDIKTDLTLDMYPHIDKEVRLLTQIISTTMREKTVGINVLLWGPPGCGKTEFVIAFCLANNLKLRVIGDYSQKTDAEKTRAERLLSLKLAIKLYGHDENTLLLFDEMEDLFKEVDLQAAFSKAYLNRIIETALAPIIWTTNRIDVMGAAMRRRMVYNILFKVPPSHTREMIWRHYVSIRDLSIPDKTITDLAVTYDIPPSSISNATKIAKMSGFTEEDDIREIIVTNDTLMRGGDKRRFDISVRKDTPYDLSWVNSEVDLHKMTERLTTCEPNFSICLHGPAGTGKSEYMRYIAKLRGQRVLFKRYSDLESKWLGETAKNIAKAFDDAREEGWFLIIDEGDSFLEDRRGARQSWEKTKVNEILSQMEFNEQPFGITTNLMDNLDPAAMRRFTFKAKFDYLLPDQAKAIFEAYFKVVPPRRILGNYLITPGDIAAVYKKAKIMREERAEEIMQMVEAETMLKKVSNSIGFSVAH